MFVSRQDGQRWEEGARRCRTSSDVKLLSAVFGISLDALLDDRSEEYLEQTARQRRTIVLALALNAALLVEVLIGLIVTTLAYEFLPWNQAYPISRVENLVRFAVLIPASVFAMKMGRIKREHELSICLKSRRSLGCVPTGREAAADFYLALPAASLVIVHRPHLGVCCGGDTYPAVGRAYGVIAVATCRSRRSLSKPVT